MYNLANRNEGVLLDYPHPDDYPYPSFTLDQLLRTDGELDVA